jgi:phospholipid/cholesterol/gamma-HCH transport system substrate-binding protein
MDQSKFNNASTPAQIAVPRRSFSLEFFVGIFTMAGVAAAAYLSVGLAGVEIGPKTTYPIYAEFYNVSGLKYGASVELAGVPVGEVSEINLNDPKARVTLKIKNDFKLRDDDTLAIRTKGIIGDRYVKISRGGSDDYVAEGGTISVADTESVIDIEDVISKVVHSLSGEKDESSSKTDTKATK